jgi:hypothetical protein
VSVGRHDGPRDDSEHTEPAAQRPHCWPARQLEQFGDVAPPEEKVPSGHGVHSAAPPAQAVPP